MSFHPQPPPANQSTSLREEAAARVDAASLSSSRDAGISAAHPLSAPLTQHQQQQHIEGGSAGEGVTMEEARKRWRQHGSDASQALEDRRSRLLASSGGHQYSLPAPSYPYPSGAASAAVAAHGGGAVGTRFPGVPPGEIAGVGDIGASGGGAGGASSSAAGSSLLGPVYSVRVLSAENRTDISGARFTSYVLSVETTRPASRSVIEHRFSEFARLHRELDANGATMGAKFPSKLSMFGRLGNWTPGAALAPEKQRDLIEYRKTKLDVWLVELCELMNRGEILGEVREQCAEFLQVSGAARPPCDRANPVNWDGLNRSERHREGGATAPQHAAAAASIPATTAAGSKHASGAEKYISNPLSFTLGSSIRQAAYTVMHMCGSRSTWSSSDRSIPLDLLHQARGLCVLTVVKAGLVVSGRVGTGLIVARSADGGWSPPSAVGTVGMGWGALIGGDITTYLIVLNTDAAVRAFAGDKGTVNLGAELGVAVGPVGRGATGNLGAGGGGVAPAYSYAHSKGLFAGISVEGSVVSTRADVNAKFYGRDIDARTLLFGNARPRPRAARSLYDALDEAMGADLPVGGFRPSRMFEKGPPRCGQYGQDANGGMPGGNHYLSSPPPMQYGSAMATPMPPPLVVGQAGQQQQFGARQTDHLPQGMVASSSNGFAGPPR